MWPRSAQRTESCSLIEFQLLCVYKAIAQYHNSVSPVTGLTWCPFERGQAANQALRSLATNLVPRPTSRGALHGGTDAVESLKKAGSKLPGVPVWGVGADEGPQRVVGHAVADAVAIWHDGAEAATIEGHAVQGGCREVEVVGPLEAGVCVQCGQLPASLLGQALQGEQVPVKALACTTPKMRLDGWWSQPVHRVSLF